jgi:hypothetical protein
MKGCTSADTSERKLFSVVGVLRRGVEKMFHSSLRTQNAKPLQTTDIHGNQHLPLSALLSAHGDAAMHCTCEIPVCPVKVLNKPLPWGKGKPCITKMEIIFSKI